MNRLFNVLFLLLFITVTTFAQTFKTTKVRIYDRTSSGYKLVEDKEERIDFIFDKKVVTMVNGDRDYKFFEINEIEVEDNLIWFYSHSKGSVNGGKNYGYAFFIDTSDNSIGSIRIDFSNQETTKLLLCRN
jgi:hypothetical protein